MAENRNDKGYREIIEGAFPIIEANGDTNFNLSTWGSYKLGGDSVV